MRVRKQIPTMYNSQAPQLAAYHQGPQLTNGALEFVYDKPVTYPLQTMWGPGIETISQFSILQTPQVEVNLALMDRSTSGTLAGSIAFQALLEEDNANAQSN